MLLNKPSQYIEKLTQKPFLKNLSMVIGGTAMSQLITVACTPIIARQYGADALGLFGIFMALTGLLATIVTGRYNVAVMLPKNHEDSGVVVQLCFVVSTLMTLLISSVVFIAGDAITTALKAPQLIDYLWLLPLIVFILGFKQTIEQWLSRHKYFAIISLALLISSILSNAFKIGMGFLDNLSIWLIAGSCLAFFIQVLMMLWQSKRSQTSLTLTSISWDQLKAKAVKYAYLPRYRAPKDFLNAIAYNAPVLFLAAFFGPIQVGLFTLAERLLRLPGQVIGDSVRKVLYQKMAETYNKQANINRLLIRSTAAMAALSIVPFGIIVFWGAGLFAFVFGDEWRVAGDYAAWLSIAMFFNFIAIPSVVVIPVLKLERLFFGYEIVYTIVQLTSLFIGAYILNNVYYAIAFYCASGAILKALLPIIVFTSRNYQTAIKGCGEACG